MYEPIDEISESEMSYFKYKEMGEQLVSNRIHGYLPSRLMLYLANLQVGRYAESNRSAERARFRVVTCFGLSRAGRAQRVRCFVGPSSTAHAVLLRAGFSSADIPYTPRAKPMESGWKERTPHPFPTRSLSVGFVPIEAEIARRTHRLNRQLKPCADSIRKDADCVWCDALVPIGGDSELSELGVAYSRALAQVRMPQQYLVC